MAPDSAELVARLYNAAWTVRYYVRGGRSAIQRLERQAAIRALGLVVREVFNATDDYEPLLVALFDGLHPRDAPPF